MKVLAARLKWLREKNRYTQTEVAKKIDMTPSGYQKIEYANRDPKIDVLIKLADIYETTIDFIVGRNDGTAHLAKIFNKMQDEKNMLNYLNVRLHEATNEGKKELMSELMFDIYDVQQGINSMKRDYIKELFNLPYSNINKNHVVKEYQPVFLNVSFDLDISVWNIKLFSQKSDLNIWLKSFKEKEVAVEQANLMGEKHKLEVLLF